MATLTHAGARLRSLRQSGLWSWITTVDHKRIGILYMISGTAVFLLGGLEALLIRTQLAQPGLNIVGPDTFNQLFTMHALTMVFGAAMPVASGFINYFLPLQIGARDVAFPRLNALSYWLYLFAALFLNTSWFLGGAPGQGWFAYANLTTNQFAGGAGMDFYVLAAQLLGISSMIAAFNFIATILNLRAPGLSIFRLPIFVWTTLLTSILVVFSFPPFTADLFLLMFDRWFGTVFFQVSAGANLLLWQHLFWLFGHPEVYILILPAFGIISEIIPVFSGKPLFGYMQLVGSLILLSFLSFMVWSHHMFTTGMGPLVNSIFSISTMSISIPTGLMIFNWLGTMWQGKVRFTTAMLFAVGFIAEFTLGGLSGVLHAAGPADFQQHDTYFIIAHFHYVLVGGLIFALFAAAYYWMPKIAGRFLDEKLGQWHFWLVVLGFNLTFMPLHWVGLLGMPRRVYTYTNELGLAQWNLTSTVGAFILGIGVLVFLVNLLVSFRRPLRPIGGDPWDGRTLEWSIPSPAPVYNFATIPTVRGLDAHWVEKESPGAAAPKPRGKVQIHMPYPSYLPMLFSLCLLIASYGMLFRNWPMALLGFAATAACFFALCFEDTAGYHIEVEEGSD